MKRRYLLILALLASKAFGQAVIPIINSSTTLNSTAVINSSGAAALSSTSSTTVPTYIVAAGAGSTGQAQLVMLGLASCTMDTTIASAASGYYVIASTSTAGYCHPQSAAPSAGVWVLGYLISSTTTSGSTALVNVDSYVYGGTGGGGSGISGLTAGYIPLAGSSTTLTGNAHLDDGVTTTGTITSSEPFAASSYITSGSGAGYFNAYNSAHTYYTQWSSAATANNIIQGFATAPTSGDLVKCITTSITCVLTDTGLLASQVVTASSPGVGIGHFAGSTQALTSSLIAIADLSASGTPSSTTYLRGDNTWATPSGGSGLPSASNTQTYYYNGSAGAATSAVTINSASAGSPVGINGQAIDTWVGPTTSPTLSASCSGTTSCSLSSVTNLPTTGGVVLITNNGSGEYEFVGYTGISGSTITTLTRGMWGTASGTRSSGDNVYLVEYAIIPPTSGNNNGYPNLVVLSSGAVIINPTGSFFNGTNVAGQNIYLGNTLSASIVSFPGSYPNAQSMQTTGGTLVFNNAQGNNTFAVDINGVPAVAEATLAVTSSTTSITPVSGVVGLTGTAPTALETMTPSASCTTANVGCEEKILGVGATTTTGGNFYAAYTFAPNVPAVCTYIQIAAPTASKWYCHV